MSVLVIVFRQVNRIKTIRTMTKRLDTCGGDVYQTTPARRVRNLLSMISQYVNSGPLDIPENLGIVRVQ